MGQVMRKCVLYHMRTTKVQISLRIHKYTIQAVNNKGADQTDGIN